MADIVDSILIRLRGVQLAPDQAERIKQAVDARTVLPEPINLQREVVVAVTVDTTEFDAAVQRAKDALAEIPTPYAYLRA